mmetsp:Transcript_82202/g.266196  ORF Transcript_82202/g.266196 Transcript_82202/m.266196 type:complete len:232 (+) Transcript_82202:544-1239(+)
MPARDDFDRGVQLPHALADAVSLRGVHEVALVQKADVADGQLLPQQASDVRAETAAVGFCATTALHGLEEVRIGDADHAVELKGGLDKGVCEEGLRHGDHLREARALNQQVVQCRSPTFALAQRLRPLRQPLQGLHHVAAHPAAEASVGHRDDLGLALLKQHQLVVDGDAPKLVLHHPDALAVTKALQNEVQEGRLAGTQEARQDGRSDSAFSQRLTLLRLSLLRRRQAAV